jgi:iron uptake system component EfeO
MNCKSFFCPLVLVGLLTISACSPSTTNQTNNPSAAENSANAAKTPTEDPAVKLATPIASYKTYILGEVDQFTTKTKKFTDAVIAGDLAKAQQLYAPARVHWERAEPIAELFADLDGKIDARADDFAKQEADPAFKGYHRLEKALFKDKKLKDMTPIAKDLMTDTLMLQKRIKELKIPPKNMVGGAAALLEEVAKTKVSGEEERYSRTDLWDFDANVTGAKKIIELLRPNIQEKDAKLLTAIDESFIKIETRLAKYKDPKGGFVSYEKVTDTDRNDFKALVAAHAEQLSQLRGTLGVD